MTDQRLKEIFQLYTGQLPLEENFNELCDMHNVEIKDFFGWLTKCSVRFAKWKEFSETVAHDQAMKNQKRSF